MLSEFAQSNSINNDRRCQLNLSYPEIGGELMVRLVLLCAVWHTIRTGSIQSCIVNQPLDFSDSMVI